MKFDYLFEISSEAGRKVGGIYTVLRSKSAQLVKLLQNKYILFGLHDEKSMRTDFVADDAPADIEQCFTKLKDELGIRCYWGRWKEGSNARIIIVDAWDFGEQEVAISETGMKEKRINSIKEYLWKDYGIDSLLMGADFNTNVLWSYAVGVVIKSILELERFKGRRTVAHFHEWLSGAGLLYLKSNVPNVALVFTTHATSLGRTLASTGRDIVNEAMVSKPEGKRVDQGEAYKYKLEGQHLLEKACAKQAHIFTTVSEITGLETEYILDKAPDIVTPNALNFEGYEPINMLIKKSFVNREKVKAFLRSYFLPYYPINIHNCPIIYLSGRYEVIDKGIDIFIDALAKLNEELKRTNYERNIFAFIFVPSNIRGPNSELRSNIKVMEQVEELIDDSLATHKDKFLGQVTKNEKYECNMIDIAERVKSLVKSFEKSMQYPPLSAHQLNYTNDKIINLLLERGLENKQEDKVKVIFYPTYVRDGDGVLNMDYYEVINGMDIGVFPSRYEPWGYTPIEAGTFLNVSFTTDYSGYGMFIRKNAANNSGIKVINMQGMKPWEIVNDLENELELLANMQRDSLRNMKMEARRVAELSDWKTQINKYIEAYERAISKV